MDPLKCRILLLKPHNFLIVSIYVNGKSFHELSNAIIAVHNAEGIRPPVFLGPSPFVLKDDYFSPQSHRHL